MIKEKIKAGDFFTLYHLDDEGKADCSNVYCWPIISIARAITVNMEERYIGCNMIYPPRYLNKYREMFYTKIDLDGWRWRYDFDFLFNRKGIRRSTSNEIFRYVSEYSTFVQDLDPFLI